MAATLENVDAVRLWHAQALFKGAWANAPSWHNDNPYWSFFSRNATTLWIALDGTTIQNGALNFLPEAYKTATFDNVNIGELDEKAYASPWKKCPSLKSSVLMDD